MIRFLAFLGVVILSVITPLYIFVPAAVLYIFYFSGYEIIFLAACVDVFYGGYLQIPYYTISAMLITVLLEYIRPNLMTRN